MLSVGHEVATHDSDSDRSWCTALDEEAVHATRNNTLRIEGAMEGTAGVGDGRGTGRR